MFEKYHAVNVGYPGGGGEYIVQEGFGWTNGVVLWIMHRFGTNLTAPSQCLRIEREIYFKQNQENDSFKDELNDNTNNIKGMKKRYSVMALSIIVKILLFLKIV